jgi:secreted trypsin-like serine protease
MARRLLHGCVVVLLGLACAAPPAGAVVGGSPVAMSKYPWFVSLDGCGGSLVAPDRVLTAAHCVEDKTPAQMGTVRFGQTKDTRKVVALAAEPRFVAAELDGRENPEAAKDDVAILALDRPVTGVRPVTLATGAPRGRVELIGRGATRAGAIGPLRSGRSGLRHTTLDIMANGKCDKYWHHTKNPAYHHAFDPSVMLCASAARRGICQGDSGGPLLTRTRAGALRQVGVVSWLGDRCGVGPSVFARVASMRAFIGARDEPWAPLSTGTRAAMTGTPAVGSTLTCSVPAWSTPPATTTFRWTAHRGAHVADAVRQSGPSATYTVGAEDAGASLRCEAIASTAGGVTRLFAQSPRIG